MSQLPDWFLDEQAYAGRENLDPEHVSRYDLKEDADATAEVEVVIAAGIGADSTVVELGPGTGQFTVAMAPHCRLLIAVDPSPVMLDQLQANLARRGTDNVEVVRAGFLSYEHRGPAADAVYTRFALHHLPDFWKVVALTRMRAVLRSGGLLRLSDVVFDFAPDETVDRVEAWAAAYGAATDSAWGRNDIVEHVRDEHSTFTWLLEPMIERAGFAIEQADRSADGLFAHYLARAR